MRALKRYRLLDGTVDQRMIYSEMSLLSLGGYVGGGVCWLRLKVNQRSGTWGEGENPTQNLVEKYFVAMDQ